MTDANKGTKNWMGERREVRENLGNKGLNRGRGQTLPKETEGSGVNIGTKII